jgi:RNA polymerase sigma-70 factor (ECF subfamily)
MNTTELQQKFAAQWVHEHSDELYGFVWKRVRHHETARDLVQETFLAAWRNVHQYDPQKPVRTWLFAIVRNKLIDHYRKAATQAGEESLSASFPFFDEQDHWKKGAYPQKWDTAHTVHQKEFWNIFMACSQKLKQMQQAIFSMKYLDGEDSETICAALNISNANYWVLMHRAKLQLRGCLEKNWFTS